MPTGNTDRISQMTQAGIAAAVQVAREQGLPVREPRLLSSRGNVLVHLYPAPVVARVATLTGWIRDDPFPWLAREVTAADHLSRHGAPVVAPTDLSDPVPHQAGGLALSLWSYVPASPLRPGPAETGRALALLHSAGQDFSWSAAGPGPADRPDRRRHHRPGTGTGTAGRDYRRPARPACRGAG